MKLREIAQMPTCTDQLKVPERSHESCLRAFQILEKVKEYLEKGVPPEVILEIVGELQEVP